MLRHINCLLILLSCTIFTQALSTTSNKWLALPESNSPFQTQTVTQPNHRNIMRLTTKYLSAKSAYQQLAPLSQALEKKCQLHPIANQQALWCIGEQTCCHSLQHALRLSDKQPKQIRIRAKVIRMDHDRARTLGIAFKTIFRDSQGLSSQLPKLSTLDGSAIVSLAQLGDNNLFTMEISALEQQGRAKVIAQPNLITANNQAAVIEAGEEVPYQQNTSSGATNVAFKKAVLRLSVTPQVLRNNRINCSVDIHQDKVTPINVNGVPIIHTQHIQTHATVRNHHTLVLGGIITNSSVANLQSVPGLSRIPIMGNLFKHRQLTSKQQELFLFITPEIIN